MSPLIFMPSFIVIELPPTIINRRAFFTSSRPYISGEIDLANYLKKKISL